MREHIAQDEPTGEQASAGHGTIDRLIEAVDNLLEGDFTVRVPPISNQRLERLAASLRSLGAALARRQQELATLTRITTRINAGLLLDEIMDGVFTDFRDVIPFDRLGFALLEDEGRVLRARWARTVLPTVHLPRGFSAPMVGSSLQDIIATGQPRVINDLHEYLRLKPESASTQLVVSEGIRSSLTCPLIANGVPVGFLFFSSASPGTYRNEHVALYRQIAEQLSVIVEKGHLVSELSDQQARTDEQNIELRRLSELKNSLLGMAAHDLRNPVAIIQMMTGILRNPTLNRPPEERQRMLDDIHRQTEHMLALLNDLLDLSVIESGTVSVAPESVDLPVVLQEAQARHQMLASPKRIRIALQAPREGSLHADPLRLRQVLDNLMSNAVKFSPVGSTVTVSAERRGTDWRIAVRDAGPGLTEEDRAKLFQQFSKLSARPTGGETSTGLGLAIAKQVVAAQGGTIHVDSTPGDGATFWFTMRASEVVRC